MKLFCYLEFCDVLQPSYKAAQVGLGCSDSGPTSCDVGDKAGSDENKSIFLVGIILSWIVILCTVSLCCCKQS